MMKTSCFDCTSKQKGFCRRNNVAKNSPICELIQKKDFKTAKIKLENKVGG